MAASETNTLDELIRHGFRTAYRSTAVTVLVHAEQPGLEVRLGTTQVVIERDGREIYRASHSRFDIERAMAAIAAVRSRESS